MLAEEREECGGCGHHPDDTGDASMRGWQVARRVCRACEVLEAEVANDVETGRRFGVRYAVRRSS